MDLNISWHLYSVLMVVQQPGFNEEEEAETKHTHKQTKKKEYYQYKEQQKNIIRIKHLQLKLAERIKTEQTTKVMKKKILD